MNLEYIILFILGGTMICLLNYYSKMNNTLSSAIIPIIPILFIIGYFMLHYYGNVFSYSKKALKCIIIYFVFLSFLILFLYYLKNELQCIALSIMILLLIYYFVYKYL